VTRRKREGFKGTDGSKEKKMTKNSAGSSLEIVETQVGGNEYLGSITVDSECLDQPSGLQLLRNSIP
jgi:hypothetical protein